MLIRVAQSFQSICILFLVVGTASAALEAAESKNLLVVTVTKGFRHSSIPTAEAVLGSLAERHGSLSVEYARTDEEIAERMTPESLRAFDGVVFANTTGELPIPDKSAFMDWIKSGKGFVGMHSASDTFHQFRPYIEMIGGEFLTHGPQVEVDVVNEDADHVACQHYGSHFKIYDEIYIQKSFHRDRVHGLLTLHNHPNSKVPGDYPIAWTKTYGKGKVFYTSLGHREDVWTNREYQEHIMGGILWSLGLVEGEGSPTDKTFQLAASEKDAGFKRLFNGTDLSGWKLRREEGPASWSAQNGMLVNTLKEGEHGTDLISEEKFWNFTVRFEYQVPKASNSGFYLRGRHEIQILEDAAGRKLADGGNGAIYSIKPVDIFVSRKAGEWQEVEATIEGDRVTVFLNGVKVHNQVEVKKATGSELDTELDQPGPILLQGDHGAVAFRNVRIKVLD
ncbi:ThuA domain-containing protein [bacterium]|jgi:uncharacterized protein|nr:DUF1080 domain-containing protein [Verrucomicrobiota bacterium]MDA7497340.1 ThuA domain-containing protein [bacterium]MDB4798507.1 ThuA domain-containing protein [Verrucomicrobiota bacterium]